ncbi:MAG: hypothetical protein M1820_007554 [Bogoriella megaspora]|nr:MAG: hypothetical protein M1820_007554 [Bogoriella megaspora]
MLLVNPAANVPIVQMSVLDSEDPQEHFRMGQALATLRDSNVAIIGSGFASFHNLGMIFSGAISEPAFHSRNEAWSQKLSEAVLERDTKTRLTRLEDWRKFPAAFEMHPRGGAEHFLPLIVCAGAGGDGKGGEYTDKFLGIDIYSFYWQ